MDQWIQKISLAAVLLIAVGTIYSSTRGVSCWPPSQFSPAQVQYANDKCYTVTNRYKMVTERIPGQNQSGRISSSVIKSNTKWLLNVLLVEAVLICSVYTVTKGLVSAGSFAANNPHNLHTSYSKTPFYLLIQIGACFCWIVLTILTVNQSDWSSEETTFLCDFQIRHLGRIHSYTVQCDEKGEILRSAFMANFSICLIVALVKLVHIVSAFIIQPLMSLKSVASMLVDNNVIKDPKQLGAGFALSDLHFVILTSGQDIKFKGSKEEEEVEK